MVTRSQSPSLRRTKDTRMDRENDKTGLSLLRPYFFYSNNDVKLSSQSVQKAHARQRKKIKSDRCHSSPGHSGLPAPGSSIRRYFRYLPIKSGNRVSNTNAGYSTEKQRDNLNKPDRIITQTVPKPGLSGEIAEAEANRTKNPLDCILRHNKCVFQS